MKYSEILFESQKYHKSLQLLDGIAILSRKMDDKLLITDLSLLESKIYQALKN